MSAKDQFHTEEFPLDQIKQLLPRREGGTAPGESVPADPLEAAAAAAQAAAQKVLLAEDVDRVIAVQKTVTALIWKEPMADGITLT